MLKNPFTKENIWQIWVEEYLTNLTNPANLKTGGGRAVILWGHCLHVCLQALIWKYLKDYLKITYQIDTYKQIVIGKFMLLHGFGILGSMTHVEETLQENFKTFLKNSLC